MVTLGCFRLANLSQMEGFQLPGCPVLVRRALGTAFCGTTSQPSLYRQRSKTESGRLNVGCFFFNGRVPMESRFLRDACSAGEHEWTLGILWYQVGLLRLPQLFTRLCQSSTSTTPAIAAVTPCNFKKRATRSASTSGSRIKFSYSTISISTPVRPFSHA